MSTIYASIGNSDDKLTQKRWSGFIEEVVEAIADATDRVHGIWFSASDSAFQNACVCFELGDDDLLDALKLELADLAAAYGQDSIAWAVAQTEFIEAAS